MVSLTNVFLEFSAITKKNKMVNQSEQLLSYVRGLQKVAKIVHKNDRTTFKPHHHHFHYEKYQGQN